MKDVHNSPTLSALTSLFDAFNDHDAEAIAAHFTPTAVFDRHVGTSPHGDRYTGPAAIAQAMRDIFRAMPDAHWEVLGHWDCAPELSVSHWMFTGTDAAGAQTRCEGLDLYTFDGGQISRKNAFRKHTS